MAAMSAGQVIGHKTKAFIALPHAQKTQSESIRAACNRRVNYTGPEIILARIRHLQRLLVNLIRNLTFVRNLHGFFD